MTFIINVIRRPVVLLRDSTNLNSYYTVKPSQYYQNCKYSGSVHRRPSAIFNEHELNNRNDRNNERRRIKNKSDKIKLTKESPKTMSQGEKEHKIHEASQREINQIMLQAKSRNRREKAETVIIEGFNFIRDSIEAGVKLRTLLFSNKTSHALRSLNLPNDVELHQIPYRSVQTWSTLATSPGIIGVFDAPDLSKTEPANDALPLTVICDSISDPKNLGSIIRAVAAVGCKKLILTKGCVDVWNPNTQRAAASAQFRLPIEMYPTWREINNLIDSDAQIYLADNDTYTLFNRTHAKDNVEEQGNDESSEVMSDEESNVKDHIKFSVDENDKHTPERNKSTSNTKLEEMQHYRKLKQEFRRFLSQLPIQIFYMPDYTRNEIVLIIGSETQGFSLDMKNFLCGRKGERLHIPLCNDINSLNSGTTVGIIVYEMRRQFLMQQLKA